MPKVWFVEELSYTLSQHRCEKRRLAVSYLSGLSVPPRGSKWLPVEEFYWNFRLQFFTTICGHILIYPCFHRASLSLSLFIPTGVLRSLWFIRSWIQHYDLKTRKTHFFQTLVKNTCAPSLKLQHISDSCMSIIREFEVFLIETVCCFRCCLSVVSVALVVGFDSFGRVWHLSCVLFRLVC
jgi:hypothetical protein